MGGTVGGPPTEGKPISNSIALASIRQVAYEVLETVKNVEWNDSGSAKVADPICQLPFLRAVVANFRVTVGRNDPCPCGGGRKFKQCFLNKQPRRHRAV
jgi:uncharacterized protein YecA (UPF0149 family)